MQLTWNSEMAVALLFFVPQLNFYLANLLSINGLRTATPLVFVILYTIGLLSYTQTLKNPKALFAVTLLIIALTVSWTLNVQTIQFMLGRYVASSGLFFLMLVYFPVFLLMLSGIDFNKMMGYFKKVSFITLLLADITFVSYIIISGDMPTDYLTFAYMMLSPLFVCMICGGKHNIFRFILIVISALIILILGSRGAVITGAVFMILFMISMYKNDAITRSHPYGKLLFIVLLVLVVINLDTILDFISSSLQAIGITSRTIEKLISGETSFIQSEGRESIWNQAIDNIGFIGKGLFGDRTVLIDEYGDPAYAHNFILELMIDLGAVLGIAVVTAFLVTIIKATRIARASGNPILQKMSYAMISVFFVRHMVSASFLTSFDFWLYWGLAVNIVENRENILSGSYFRYTV